MTDIAIRDEQNTVAHPPIRPLPQTAALSRIQAVVADMEGAHRLANALVQTSFVPTAFRGKADDATAAILYGDTIGMDPLTSLQQLHVINGKPGLYARAMVGLVMSHGHRVWTDVDTPERVVVCGQRKGDSSVERSEWTAERARRAGYYSNKKYETDPQAMLYARASGDIARRIAPDVLLGMAYNVEELSIDPGMGVVDTEPGEQPTAAATPPRGGVARLGLAVADPQPEPPAAETPARVVDVDLPPEPADDEPPAAAQEPTQPSADTEPMTRAQQTRMHALFNSLGTKDRGERLTATRAMIDRDVASSTDLTHAEATTVLDTLDSFHGDRDRFREAFGLGDQS